MARINRNGEEEQNDTALEQTVIQSLPSISITTNPVFICGVNRRINLGNWEHLDIYGGIALPMPNASLENIEDLKKMAMYAAEIGFNISSAETGSRYTAIKESQKNPRA